MTLFGFAKIVPDFVFADRNQITEGLRAPFILQYLHSIKIVLNVIVGVNNNSPRIPLPHGMNKPFLFIGLYKIIQGGQGTVSVPSQFCIRMK